MRIIHGHTKPTKNETRKVPAGEKVEIATHNTFILTLRPNFLALALEFSGLGLGLELFALALNALALE